MSRPIPRPSRLSGERKAIQSSLYIRTPANFVPFVIEFLT
jgi:hypothetical protein